MRQSISIVRTIGLAGDGIFLQAGLLLGDSSILLGDSSISVGDASISVSIYFLAFRFQRHLKEKMDPGLQYGEDEAEHLDRADDRPSWRHHLPVNAVYNLRPVSKVDR